MTRQVRVRAADKAKTVAVVLCKGVSQLPAGYKSLDKQSGGMLAGLLKRREFTAEKGAATTLYPTAGGLERIIVVGLGDPKKCTLQQVRLAGAVVSNAGAAAHLGALKVDLAPGLPEKMDVQSAARAFGEGAGLAAFDFDDFNGAVAKGGEGKKKKPALDFQVDSKCRKAFDIGLKVADSANVARQLAATPPNVANPKYIVDYCRKMANKFPGLVCRVIDAKKARQMGMGGLTAVGQAGSTPPYLICLEWKGKTTSAAAKKKAPVLLVGKAITFDTGGYSLKINNGMLGMKYDKCGGMAVIGAMHAIASLKLPMPVTGVVAAAENMVDTNAYRPDDIITMYNGVTVEVTNTDAEGRLVLADALSYGCKHYKPRCVIDLATLTGGVVVALGSYCAGVFVNDDDLRKTLFDAADSSGERLWRLPLWDEHRDQMKALHADIVNSSSIRGAHPIQGAAFLSYFAVPGGDASKIGELPWAHIDIAGVAEANDRSPFGNKGPTGYGVRLLVDTLERMK